jgi:amino acid transporter
VEGKAGLSPVDAIAIIVGIVIGAGIFKTPSLVAANSGSFTSFLLLWLAGGAISLIGALCYAELSANNPGVGGEYNFLTRAYGRSAGFLFAWGRLTVIQTGAIAAVGFVFGDYASQVLSLGPAGAAVYAAIAVVTLTALNVAGLQQGKTTQNLLTLGTLAAIIAMIVGGFVFSPSTTAEPPSSSSGNPAIGLALVFILLTYGGWNEAAYLSGELRDARRNMLRVLVISVGLITALYLLVNLAYVRVLGLSGAAGSQAVAADFMRLTFGASGTIVLSLFVALAALSTMNATIFTGARTAFAAGTDHSVLRWLGRWDEGASAPVRAMLVQGAIALGLVVFGAFRRDGFQTMVEYTAPAFWLFFLLSGISLFVLRGRPAAAEEGFRVPLYPVTPIIFCGVCAYMLYSSLAYTGLGALFGVAVLLAGVPLLLLSRPPAPQAAE